MTSSLLELLFAAKNCTGCKVHSLQSACVAKMSRINLFIVVHSGGETPTTTCSLLLFIIPSWLVYILFTICSNFDHDLYKLFMICAWPLHDFFMTSSHILILIMTCLLLVHDFCHNLYKTCSWLAHKLFKLITLVPRLNSRTGLHTLTTTNQPHNLFFKEGKVQKVISNIRVIQITSNW